MKLKLPLILLLIGAVLISGCTGFSPENMARASSCTDNKCTLYQDDPITTTIEGESVTLEATYVGSSTAVIQVNNETTDALSVLQSDNIAGFTIFVNNILYRGILGQKDAVIVTISKEITCTDSDGGIDYLVKGICIDASGTYVDECFGPSGITERYCMVNLCHGSGISNCSMLYGTGYVCADGACVLQNQTNCTSHYEYKCYAGDVYWYNSCGNTEEKKEDCTWGCENGACINYSTYCGDGICANNGINKTLDGDVPVTVSIGNINYTIEAIFISSSTAVIQVNNETSSLLGYSDYDTVSGLHVYVKNILYRGIVGQVDKVMVILGEDEVSCTADCG